MDEGAGEGFGGGRDIFFNDCFMVLERSMRSKKNGAGKWRQRSECYPLFTNLKLIEKSKADSKSGHKTTQN